MEKEKVLVSNCCINAETIQLCWDLIHKEFCATDDWHDKYVEHICNRLKKMLSDHAKKHEG